MAPLVEVAVGHKIGASQAVAPVAADIVVAVDYTVAALAAADSVALGYKIVAEAAVVEVAVGLVAAVDETATAVVDNNAAVAADRMIAEDESEIDWHFVSSGRTAAAAAAAQRLAVEPGNNSTVAT